ncbi:hypothetical protein D3C80_1643760 [compost metagenome]
MTASASEARVRRCQRDQPSLGISGLPTCCRSRYSQITRLSCSTLPSARRKAGIFPAGLPWLSSATGLTGVRLTLCSATRSVCPVSCSTTMTLRTKGEAGE